MRILGLLIAAVPFGFGVVRFMTTGTDARYLAVACASALGSLAMQLSGAKLFAVQVLTGFGASALLSAAAAWMTGARDPIAVLVVAAGFALCSAGGLAIWHLPAAGIDARGH